LLPLVQLKVSAVLFLLASFKTNTESVEVRTRGALVTVALKFSVFLHAEKSKVKIKKASKILRIFRLMQLRNMICIKKI
jgi:hypothetical protein